MSAPGPIVLQNDFGARNALTRAGFVDASVVEVPLKWCALSIKAIIDFIYKDTVRTAAVL